MKQFYGTVGGLSRSSPVRSSPALLILRAHAQTNRVLNELVFLVCWEASVCMGLGILFGMCVGFIFL